jgi:hypothetical protein
VIRAIVLDLWDMARRNAALLFYAALALVWFVLVCSQIV